VQSQKKASKRRFSVRDSLIHGRGVYASTALKAGERLLEYRGERITSAQAVERYGDNSSSGETYLFSPNEAFLIDGTRDGNSARFINHSCAPNCEALIFVDINGNERRDKVWLLALRDIAAGEELSFDYALEMQSAAHAAAAQPWTCRCGAKACRGTMLFGVA